MNVEQEEEVIRKEKAEVKEEAKEKDELKTVREIHGHRRDRRMPLSRDGQPEMAIQVIPGGNPTPRTTDFRSHQSIRQATSGEVGL